MQQGATQFGGLSLAFEQELGQGPLYSVTDLKECELELTGVVKTTMMQQVWRKPGEGVYGGMLNPSVTMAQN